MSPQTLSPSYLIRLNPSPVHLGADLAGKASLGDGTGAPCTAEGGESGAAPHLCWALRGHKNLSFLCKAGKAPAAPKEATPGAGRTDGPGMQVFPSPGRRTQEHTLLCYSRVYLHHVQGWRFCHPWLQHKFPARAVPAPQRPLCSSPPPLHLPSNLIKMFLGSTAGLARLFRIPPNINDFSFKIFGGDNKEESSGMPSTFSAPDLRPQQRPPKPDRKRGWLQNKHSPELPRCFPHKLNDSHEGLKPSEGECVTHQDKRFLSNLLPQIMSEGDSWNWNPNLLILKPLWNSIRSLHLFKSNN